MYTSLFLGTDYLKVTYKLWTQKVSGDSKKRALWSVAFIHSNVFFPFFVCTALRTTIRPLPDSQYLRSVNSLIAEKCLNLVHSFI